MVKRAAPDGYTFLVTSLGPLVITPHLIKSLQYDALKDFDTITVAVQAPNVLVVPANSKFRTLADVVAFEKANPGKVTFASSGNGSSDHLTAALFWQQTGTTGIHVPYKGGSPAVTDLLGGQVDASFQNVNAVLPHIKSGKLRGAGGDRRQALAGVAGGADHGPRPGSRASTPIPGKPWSRPRGCRPDVRSRFHAAVVAALNDPQVKQQFTAVGLEVVADTPEQFAAFQQQESARWKKVVETGHITAD